MALRVILVASFFYLYAKVSQVWYEQELLKFGALDGHKLREWAGVYKQDKRANIIGETKFILFCLLIGFLISK